jgi:F-type H+-transporting ATPase subunit a
VRNPKVLGAVLLVVIAMLLSAMLAPVPLPGIQLPAEPVNFFGLFTLPNTWLATLLADVTILVIAFAATRHMQLVPSGIQNVMEWVIEAWYDLTEDVAGHNAKKFFPWIVTIFLLVLVSNWWELVPGFDSIGWIESHTGMAHYPIQELGAGIATLTYTDKPYVLQAGHGEEEEEHHGIPTVDIDGEMREVGVLVPFLRAAGTDLNFTFALALISMFMVQFYGVQALGMGYFSKFINLKGGGMGFFLGLIELISEFAKVLSFAFRLFGNIFGGQVLLFVMAFLVPWFLPVPFYGLEIFVGLIQAFVFGILTLVFFQLGVVSHDEEHH